MAGAISIYNFRPPATKEVDCSTRSGRNRLLAKAVGETEVAAFKLRGSAAASAATMDALTALSLKRQSLSGRDDLLDMQLADVQVKAADNMNAIVARMYG